jgi:hypothetical protein
MGTLEFRKSAAWSIKLRPPWAASRTPPTKARVVSEPNVGSSLVALAFASMVSIAMSSFFLSGSAFCLATVASYLSNKYLI